MGVIICDSSSLISLSQTCNLDCLSYLTKKTSARFFITPAVEKEIVINPMNFTEHAFSAVRLKSKLSDGTLKVVAINAKADFDRLNDLSNNLFSVNGKSLRIMHAGELECLAVYKKIGAAGSAIDEKTARLLVESPEKLLESLKAEYHSKVQVNTEAAAKLGEILGGIKVIRSTEILAMAFEKGFFTQYGELEENAFHAAVHAARNAGCSITGKELTEYERMK